MILAASPLRRCLALACVLTVTAFARPAAAADPSPAPLPSPSPSGSPAPSDPCLQISAIVARPSVSTSPCSVKRGDLLVESGYSNAASGGPAGANTVSYPQANLRVGVGGNLEVDFDPPSVERASSTPRIAGTGDAMVGLHYEFGYSGNLTYGANAFYTLDTGTPAFSDNGDGLLANLDAAYTLSPAFSLFTTLGYKTQSAGMPGAPARFEAFAPSLGITLTLPQGFDAFVEGFGQTSSGPDEGGSYGFDAAVQKTLGSRVILDVNHFEYPAAQGNPRGSSTGFGASVLLGP